MLKSVIHTIKQLIELIVADLISVYAAQASFFVIISVVPFCSLLISIISLFIPSDVFHLVDATQLPAGITNMIGSTLDDLRNAPNVSLLSISAVITLWTASKGTSAILSGISTVYHAPPAKNYLHHRFRSLMTTLILIVLIIAAVALLLFGDLVGELIGGWLNIEQTTDFILRMRIPVLMAFMCIIFTAMYTYTARRSAYVKKSIFAHMPGALFASAGWVGFSMLYALYINHFPNASYIYGGLGAICLMMLWLYICMIILLLGAEVNKVVYLLIVHHKIQKKIKQKQRANA